MSDLISRQDAIDSLNEVDDGASISTAITVIEGLPSAQPEPCEDAVSRADVVDMLEMYPFTEYSEYEAAREVVKRLPSAQPEIIRCGECKHRYTEGENVVYNVCELNHNKVQPDDWFCGSAERRTDDEG